MQEGNSIKVRKRNEFCVTCLDVNFNLLRKFNYLGSIVPGDVSIASELRRLIARTMNNVPKEKIVHEESKMKLATK